MPEPTPDTLTLWLAGDVMTGRGIDQVQANPGDPALYELLVRDARDYVRLAEAVNGRVPAPVASGYVWGEALAEIDRRRPNLRLVNLETAITHRGQPWPDKGVHYRMHPANIGCLMVARIDCCALANNHVLDWGQDGLAQTLATLHQAGIQTAGAGTNAEAASAPTVLLHWGGNWGVEVPQAHQQFSRRLIELGAADLVHGHSSHHPRPVEVYRGRLILYGCGDLINDYEGIASQRSHDPSAVCLYFAQISRASGALQRLEIVPMQLRRLQLVKAHAAARRSLQSLFENDRLRYRTRLQAQPDGSWQLDWQSADEMVR